MLTEQEIQALPDTTDVEKEAKLREEGEFCIAEGMADAGNLALDMANKIEASLEIAQLPKDCKNCGYHITSLVAKNGVFHCPRCNYKL